MERQTRSAKANIALEVPALVHLNRFEEGWVVWSEAPALAKEELQGLLGPKTPDYVRVDETGSLLALGDHVTVTAPKFAGKIPKYIRVMESFRTGVDTKIGKYAKKNKPLSIVLTLSDPCGLTAQDFAALSATLIKVDYDVTIYVLHKDDFQRVHPISAHGDSDAMDRFNLYLHAQSTLTKSQRFPDETAQKLALEGYQ